MSDVKFIRVRGRVIPVKKKKKDSSNAVVAAGAAAGAGYGVAKMGSPILKRTQKLYKFGALGNSMSAKAIGITKSLNKAGLKKVAVASAVGLAAGLALKHGVKAAKKKLSGE